MNRAGTYQDFITEGIITEGKFNSRILDLVEDIQKLIKEIKKDKDYKGNKVTDQLITTSGPLIKSLHTLVESSELNEGEDYDRMYLVDRIRDLDDILTYDRKTEKDWEKKFQNYLDGKKGSTYWEDLDDEELQNAIADAESLMKKYRIRESNESVVTESVKSHKLYKKLLKFFKDDYWDEIREMARAAREYHTEYDLDMLYTDWKTNPKAPQPLNFRKLKTLPEWNEKGKAYILNMLDKMGEQALDAWFDDFEHWL